MSSIREWLRRRTQARTEAMQRVASEEFPRLYPFQLEERRVLDAMAVATLSDLGVLTLSAGGQANDGYADTYQVAQNVSGQLEVRVNDQIAWSGNSELVQGIEIQGSQDQDLVTVHTDAMAGKTLRFDGGVVPQTAQTDVSDQLTLMSSSAERYDRVRYALGNEIDVIELNRDGFEQSTLSLIHIDRIIDLTQSTHRVLELGSSVSIGTLNTSSDLQEVSLDQQLSLQFATPLDQLIIDTTDTLSASQTLTWQASSGPFEADIEVRGDVQDQVLIEGVFESIGQNVWVQSGSIVVDGTINVGAGGTIFIETLGTESLEVYGNLLARGDEIGARGGTIELFGDRILIYDGAKLDVSGEAGGGEVFIGGGLAGQQMSTANARVVYLEDGSQVFADALGKGDGGRIIIWSENYTQIDDAGNLKARGGSSSGNGGFIETSSKGQLAINGGADAAATNGSAGIWLLDPFNVTISNVGVSIFPGVPASDVIFSATSTTTISASSISQTLDAGTNVFISTGSTGSSANGNITINSAITLSQNKNVFLTLFAAKDIIVNQSITASNGTLGVIFNAGEQIQYNADINTNGGSFSTTDQGFEVNGTRTLTTNGGDITFNSASQVSGTALGSSNFTIVAGSGDVDLDNSTITNLNSFTILSSNVASLGSVATGDGGISVTATSQIRLAGNLSTILETNSGGIFVASSTGTMELENSVTINTNSTSGTDGNVTVDLDLTGDADIAKENLTITAGTASVMMLDRIGETIGTTSSVGSLNISSATLVFLDSVNVSGSVTINNSSAFNQTSAADIDAVGNIQITADNLSVSASVTSDANVTLTGSSLLSSAGGGEEVKGNNVTLVTNSLSWLHNISHTGSGGNVTFKPFSNSTVIDVGDDVQGTGLFVSQSVLNLVGTGFDSIIIGSGASQTGAVVVAADAAFSSDVQVANSGLIIDAVTITVQSNVTLLNTGSDLTIGRNNATVSLAGSIILSTESGDIQLIGNTRIPDNATLSLNSTAAGTGADVSIENVTAQGTGTGTVVSITAGAGNVQLGTLNSHTIGSATSRIDDLIVDSANDVIVNAAIAAEGARFTLSGEIFLNNTLDLASEASGFGYALRIQATDISITDASVFVTGSTTEDLLFIGTGTGTFNLSSGLLDISNSPLSSIYVDGNFSQVNLGANVVTGGSFVQIDSAVRLTADISLTTNGGSIFLNGNVGSITGFESLTLDAGTTGVIDTAALGNATNPLNGLVILNADTVNVGAITSNFGVDINAGSIVVLGAIDSSGAEVKLQSYDPNSAPGILLNSLDSRGQNVRLIAQQLISLVGGTDSVTSSVAGATLFIQGSSVATPITLGSPLGGNNGTIYLDDASINAIGNGFDGGIEFGTVGQTGIITVQGATQSFGNALTYHLEGGAPMTISTQVNTTDGGATNNAIRILGGSSALIFLASSLTTDGGDISISGDMLIVSPSTIAALDSGNGNGGSATTGGIIDLSQVSSLTSFNIGGSLNIDTRGANNGGNVLLGDVNAAGGANIVQLTVLGTGATPGQLILNNNNASPTSITASSKIDFSAIDVLLVENTTIQTLSDNQALSLGPVTTSLPNTNLTLTSNSSVNLDSVNLSGGTLTVSIDANQNGGALDMFASSGIIQAGSVSISGNASRTNFGVINNSITTTLGDISFTNFDLLTLNADLTSAAGIQLTGISGPTQAAVQLGSNVTLTMNATSNFSLNGTAFLLSGIDGSTNRFVVNGDSSELTVGPVFGLGTIVNLEIDSEGSVSLADVSLNAGALLDVGIDTDNDNVSAFLTTGNLTAGSVQLQGSATRNDAATIFAITSFAGNVEINDFDQAVVSNAITAAANLVVSDINTITLSGNSTAGGDIEVSAVNIVNLSNGAGMSAGANLLFNTNVGEIHLNTSNQTYSFTANAANATLQLATIIGDQFSTNVVVNSKGSINANDFVLQTNSTLELYVDSDNNTTSATLAVSNITAASVLVRGGTDANDFAFFDGKITTLSGILEISDFETIEFLEDVDAFGTIDISRISTLVQLNPNVDILTRNGNLFINSQVGKILLFGAAGTTHTIISTGGTVLLTDVAEETASDRTTISAAHDVNLRNVKVAKILELVADNDFIPFGEIIASGVLEAGEIIMESGGGIGNIGAIQTKTPELSAINRSEGALSIVNNINANVVVHQLSNTKQTNVGLGNISFINQGTGNVTFENVSTTDSFFSFGFGNIALTNLGGGIIIDQQGVIANGLGTITLDSGTLSDIVINAPVTTTFSSVDIDSGRDIIGTGTTTAASGVLRAVGKIGGNNALPISLGAITATALFGDINLHNNTPNLVFWDLISAIQGELRYEQTGGGSVFITNGFAKKDIDINVVGGNLAFLGNLRSEGQAGIEMNVSGQIDLLAPSTIETTRTTARVIAHAGGALNMQPGTILRLGTSNPNTQTTIANPFPPVIVIPLNLSNAANVSLSGLAQVEVFLGDIFNFEENFEVEIDWLDGTVLKYPPTPDDLGRTRLSHFPVDGPYIFKHQYFTNPGASANSPIPIEFTVNADPNNLTDFSAFNGAFTDFFVSQFPVVLTVPESGISSFSINLQELTPVLESTVIVEQTSYIVSKVSDAPAPHTLEQTAIPSEAINEEQRKFVLKIVFRGKEESADIELPGNVLSNLPSLFKALEDDRYRIYLVREDGVRQLVKDFYLRDHIPVELDEFNSEAPATQESIQTENSTETIKNSTPNPDVTAIPAFDRYQPVDINQQSQRILRVDPAASDENYSFRKAARALRRSPT